MFGTWLLSMLGRKISGGKINKMVFPSEVKRRRAAVGV